MGVDGNMVIREANSDDALNLAALSIQVWLHTYATEGVRAEIARHVLSTYTEERYLELLADPAYRLLVSAEGENLLGFVAVNLDSRFQSDLNGYEVVTLYVQEHFQRRGIGRSLLREVGARHGTAFWLSTWVHNLDGIAFYERLGFRDIGRVDFVLEGELHENRVLAHRDT